MNEPLAHAETGGFLAIIENPTVWVAVGFLLFFLFFGRKIFSALANALDERSARIAKALDDAEQLREEAEKLLAEYQRKQREALRDAEDIIRHAQEEAGRLRANTEAELKTTIARRRQMALDKIAQLEREVLAEVRARASDAAIAIASQLLQDHLADGKTGRADILLNDAISRIEKQLH